MSNRFKFTWDEFVNSKPRKHTTKNICVSIVAILLSLLLAILIATSVNNNFGAFGGILYQIVTYPFLLDNLNSTFSMLGIFAVAGLSFIFAFKAGMFNIGISGQMFFAAVVAVLAGQYLSFIPSGAGQIVILLICVASGMFISLITVLLKVFFNAHEVVTAIMLNWVVYFVGTWMLTQYGPMDSSSGIYTRGLSDNLILTSAFGACLPIVIITVLLVLFTWVAFKYSVIGKKIVQTGMSETAAKYAGYSVQKNQIIAMLVSGAMAGILGMMVYMGKNNSIPATIAAKSIPVEGFNGISVGLIAALNPIAVIPVSLFFAMIDVAKGNIQQIYSISPIVTDLIFGITIYGAAIINLFHMFKPWIWLSKMLIPKSRRAKWQKKIDRINSEIEKVNDMLLTLWVQTNRKRGSRIVRDVSPKIKRQLSLCKVKLNRVRTKEDYLRAEEKIIKNYLKIKESIKKGA